MPCYVAGTTETQKLKCKCGFISNIVDIRTMKIIRKLHFKHCEFKNEKINESTVFQIFKRDTE